MPPAAGAPEESRVSARAAAYLAERATGGAPDLRSYVHDLSAAERAEFEAMVGGVAVTRDPSSATPRVIADRYELEDRLGAGGFGQVWRARDRRVGRDVAVKLLNLTGDAADAAPAVFAHEREALAQIEHPGVVRILDAGEHAGTLFLVTELVRGRSLEQIVRTLHTQVQAGEPTLAHLRDALAIGTLPSEAPPSGASVFGDARDYAHAVARVCVELLRALEAVHGHGIVHRDIKPANVMLSADGAPKLLDFGIAAVKHSHVGITSRLVGTENYLAPEQLLKLAVGRDARTDVYQTGLVLYELLCLRAAFPKDGAIDLFAAIGTGRCARPRARSPWIPIDLEDICLRAIEAAPGRRYATAAAFRTDLERWLNGDTPDASRRGSMGRMLRAGRGFARRNRVAVGLAITLVTGVTAGAVWLPRGPRVARTQVVAYEPASGRATAVVDADQAVVFTLIGHTPGEAAAVTYRAVQVAVAEGEPAWALPLRAGDTAVRVVVPAEFWPAQDEARAAGRTWELRSLGFPPDALALAAATWQVLGSTLEGADTEPGLSTLQAMRALDAGRGGSAVVPPAFDPATILRRLTEAP